MMRSGQTMVEYVLALAALLGVIAALGYVVVAAQRASDRANTFIGSEYP